MTNNKDIKSKVYDHPLFKEVIDKIQDKEEKQKTLQAIENMLESLQTQTNKLVSDFESLKKKQENS